jgi:hypothetical protein
MLVKLGRKCIRKFLVILCDSLFISHLVEHGSLLDLDFQSAWTNLELIQVGALLFISR